MRRRANGFILLMVLVLLALAAAMLAGVCRMSMRSALLAQDEMEDLQRRWGMLSCEAAVLPRAELLLRRAEFVRHQPLGMMTLSVVLGEQRFVIVVADEQAKVNVNTIYATQGRAEAERVVREAAGQGGQGGQGGSMAGSRPLRADLRPGSGGIVFGSFGQLFSTDDPLPIQRVSDNLSCWGNGRLMWRRASASALDTTLDPVIGVALVRRMLAIRSANPDANGSVLLSDPQIAQSDGAGRLRELVDDESHCHSVWIIGTDGETDSQTNRAASRRASYHLAISQESEVGSAIVSFSW